LSSIQEAVRNTSTARSRNLLFLWKGTVKNTGTARSANVRLSWKKRLGKPAPQCLETLCLWIHKKRLGTLAPPSLGTYCCLWTKRRGKPGKPAPQNWKPMAIFEEAAKNAGTARLEILLYVLIKWLWTLAPQVLETYCSPL
jgi:hypothetical protein